MSVKVKVSMNRRTIQYVLAIGAVAGWLAIAISDNALVEFVAASALFGLGWVGRRLFMDAAPKDAGK